MVCEVCQEAKQRIKMGNIRKASRPLQIIHTDLCGSVDPDTWEVTKRYFVTFLDDYMHYVIVFRKKIQSTADNQRIRNESEDSTLKHESVQNTMC